MPFIVFHTLYCHKIQGIKRNLSLCWVRQLDLCWMCVTFEPLDGIVQDTIMLLCQIHLHRSNLENHFHWTLTNAASINATWISVPQGESFTLVRCGDAGEFSTLELISGGLEESGNVCCGQMNPCLSLFWKNGRKWNRVLKDERDQPDFQTPVLVLTLVSLQTVWATCIIVNVPLTCRHIFWLYRKWL